MVRNSSRDGNTRLTCLTCLLRNLYVGQEATVRTRHGTIDWFQTGKGVCQGCILSPCLLNLYAEYIMWNTGLNETQAGLKIAREKYQQPQICRWHHPYGSRASLVAQTVKRLPTMWETRVRSLGQEVPLKKEMATQSSILARKIPWTEEPGRLQSVGSPRVRYDWATSLYFMAESKEELKSSSLDEESEKASLNLNIQKTKIMASGSIIWWQIDGEPVETVTHFILLGSKITADGDCIHEIKRCLLLGRKAMTNLDSVLKNRHHLADKGLYSESCGFSSSQVWMWELNHKESWALKNWCFQTVALETTLGSPLDSKEIKPVKPKGEKS